MNRNLAVTSVTPSEFDDDKAARRQMLQLIVDLDHEDLAVRDAAEQDIRAIAVGHPIVEAEIQSILENRRLGPEAQSRLQKIYDDLFAVWAELEAKDGIYRLRLYTRHSGANIRFGVMVDLVDPNDRARLDLIYPNQSGWVRVFGNDGGQAWAGPFQHIVASGPWLTPRQAPNVGADGVRQPEVRIRVSWVRHLKDENDQWEIAGAGARLYDVVIR